MSQPYSDPNDGVIRITNDDANSAHVDDLLKRQASLRGDRGISRSRKRAWYYSNWFVFAIAGGLGALLAAAIIEPYFDDLIYFRGKIDQIDIVAPVPFIPLDGKLDGEMVMDWHNGVESVAKIEVNGENIWLLSVTKVIGPDGEQTELDLTSLQVGDDVGIHVEYEELQEGYTYAAAIYIETAPTRKGTGQSLFQLDAQSSAASLLLFPSVAALVGLAIGAVDGAVCRLWRRVLLSGSVGLLVGFIGGFIAQIFAGIIYAPLTALAMDQQVAGGELGDLTTMGMLTQVTGRALAWCLAGMSMGLAQGIAMRSGRLLLYGFLGGAIGGLLGGIVFDPIDLLLFADDHSSAHWSRLVSLATIGVTVGLMIGIVELLARDAWLQMLKGPLSGKEFLIFKDVVNLGASPRSDIYMFNDDQVADRHATIRASADHFELEAVTAGAPVLVNGRSIERTRLQSGDEITLGDTVFVFQRRTTK